MSEDLRELTNNDNISLDSESLDKVLSIFETVSKMCTDICVVEGKICQHSDRKSSIITTDLSSILNNNTYYLSGLASKNELLEPFRKQQASINIETNENSYIFKDEYSHLTFQKPLIQYITNKYMKEEELNTKLSIDDDQVFNYEMKKFLVERLVAMQKGLAANMVKIIFNGDKADFLVTTSDNSSTIVGKLITVDLEREIHGECVFPIQPFILSNDDVFLTCFFRSDGENLLINFTSNIKDTPFTIWCISRLVSDEIDEEE